MHTQDEDNSMLFPFALSPPSGSKYNARSAPLTLYTVLLIMWTVGRCKVSLFHPLREESLYIYICLVGQRGEQVGGVTIIIYI